MILILIVILVLTLPLLFKRIEEALEIFLLIMGLITLTITSQWSLHLIKEILLEPIKITITVFVAGILFNIIQKTIENNIGVIADKIGVKLFVFLLVVGLGFLSSIVTAIIAAIIFIGFIASKIAVIDKEPKDIQKQEKHETLGNIFYRSLKVYVFVAGLVCLGVGLRPLIDLYLSNVSIYAIYWINITSAFLDNATLGAAEIGPALSLPQIKAAVLALIISGGMLIPGNIPNIITANKLGIGSKEWLKIGVPFGLVLLIVYFIIIVVINHI